MKLQTTLPYKLVITAAFLASLTAGALAETVERQLGIVTIKLAVPPGLSDWTDRDTTIVRAMKAWIPSTHELIALFAKDGSESYTAIQALKSLKNLEVSIADFKKVINETKSSVEAGSVQDASRKFAEELNRKQPAKDLGVTIKVGESITLPVFDESTMHVSWPFICKMSASQDNQTETLTVAGTSTLLWLNRRIVFVYLCAPFEGPDSLQTLKESTTRYTKDLMHLNGIPTDDQMKKFGEVLKKKREEMDRYQKMLFLIDTALVLAHGSGDRTTYRAKGKVLNSSPDRLQFLVLRLNVYLKDDTLASSTELKLDGRDEAQGKSSTEFKAVPASHTGSFSTEVEIPKIQEGSHWKLEVVNTSFF